MKNTKFPLLALGLGFILMIGLPLMPNSYSVRTPTTWAYKYDVYPTTIAIAKDGGYLIGCASRLMKLDTVGTPQWGKRSDLGIYFRTVAQTRNGGYIAAAVDDELNEFVPIVYRLTPTGSVVWSKRYHRNRFDRVLTMIQTRDGGFLLAGDSGFSRSDTDMWLVKTGAGGLIQWQKKFNVATATSVDQLSNGDFLVGTAHSSVLRLSPSGIVRWQKKYPYGGIMRALPDGSFVLGGTRFVGDVSYAVITKCDSAGTVIFSKTYAKQKLLDFRITSDGGYVLIAEKSFPKPLTVTKLDSSGNVVWRKLFTDSDIVRGTFSLGGTEIRQTLDGGYIFVSAKGLILKLDPSGNIANLCKNISTTVPTTVQSISVKPEARFPTATRTFAVPLFGDVLSDETVTANSICSP